MADVPPTAVDVARRLADALEAHGLDYAIGGALALGFYAPPRATVDVDLNVFVPPATGLARALAALAQAGFAPDESEEMLQRRAIRDGQFRGYVAGMRVDVFVPAIEFYRELADRKRRGMLLGRVVWILGPEDCCILKMMFFRRKDLADVEAVVREQRDTLDRVFIRIKLVELVGADDARIRAWDEIVADVLG